MTDLGGKVRIDVEFGTVDASPDMYYLLYRFREGWQVGHFRIAAEKAWDLMQSQLPEGEQCYSIFHFESDSQLQQAGLLGEVSRSVRHPINKRIKYTYIVGLSGFSQALAVRMRDIASRVTASPAPYANAHTLDEAFDMIRQHATEG
ncbi:MAG: hypothetical protein JXN59_05180 [Anaerolineae bacterium]|nr:hypothetical protein [Anaerolineae bacterium]